MLFRSFVDGVGHDFGPDAEEIISAIQQADSLIGYLTQQIEALGLEDQVNLIIVADHGMAQNSRDKIIYVDDYINVDDLDIYSWGTSFSIRGDKQTLDSVYQQLKSNEDQFQVYKKEDIPDRFRVKNSPRFPDLLMIPESGYLISSRGYAESRENYATGGSHGYDNLAEDMFGLFLIYGPDFANGKKIDAVENVHIYELIAHLLEIESAGTDGSIEALKSTLR